MYNDAIMLVLHKLAGVVRGDKMLKRTEPFILNSQACCAKSIIATFFDLFGCPTCAQMQERCAENDGYWCGLCKRVPRGTTISRSIAEGFWTHWPVIHSFVCSLFFFHPATTLFRASIRDPVFLALFPPPSCQKYRTDLGMWSTRA